ncbi:MAG TPA: PASTA domain-containing protein [Gaiellaceae bacterium]|nr:PASTA domain-containing protein [Gaiellaceae bacterium]
MARWSPWRRRRATEFREERVATAVPPPRPFWPWLLLLLLLVLGALGVSWYLANRGETVDADEVPNLVGAQRVDAERRLQERDFESEVKRIVSEERPGTVVAQRPAAGTVYGEGGIVVLSVARDPLRTEVPDVSGLSTTQALARLRAADLRPRAQAVPSREPKGRVLRQLPGPGTEVPRRSPVVVIVSTGPELGTVPDVVGMLVGGATARVSRAGFRVRVARVPGGQPEGTVVAQNPSGGARALRRTVVRLNVSIGPGAGTTTGTTTTSPGPATVPDTVGQDEAAARGTLEGAGFVVRVVDRPAPDPNLDGVVMNQSPAGGSQARAGSAVTIFVGRLS